MSNGKVQKKSEQKESVTVAEKIVRIRTSRIRKSIHRTLQTAQFESLVIEDSIDEEIEWTTMEERIRKEQNWTTVLLTRFKEFHDLVCTDLGLEHKKAYIKQAKIEQQKQGLDLDDLDSI